MSNDATAAVDTSTGGESAAADIPDAQSAPAEVTGGAEPVSGEQSIGGEGTPEQAPAQEPVVFKIDGKEIALDVSEAAALEKVFGSKEKAQKALAADRRFREAQALRAEAEQATQVLAELKELARTDPVLAARLSGDRDAFYRALEEDLRYQGLDPEERQRVDAERERDRKAREYERLEKERQEQQAQLQTQQDAQALAQVAAQSLASAGLDASDGYLVERWAGEMQAQYDAGRRPDPAAAAARVKAWAEQSHQSAYQRLAELEEDALLARLDELGLTQKIRAADAKRLKAKEIERTRQPAGTATRRSETGEKPLTTAQYLRQLRRGQF